jgi:two-component system response regulator RegX3
MTLALREAEPPQLPTAAHPTVLVVDGDRPARESLAACLATDGFDVVTTADPDTAVALIATVRPALILLDAHPARGAGLVAFHRITAVSDTPVIMVGDRDDELDAVASLEAGAADHVTKPYRRRELAARVRAVLRRVDQRGAPTNPASPDPGVLTAGPVLIDTAVREVALDGAPVVLSRKEFDLLALLVSEAGKVVTRVQCMDQLWSERRGGDSRTLDTHIKRLRKKIERDPAHPRHVLTVRGIGYRFKP